MRSLISSGKCEIKSSKIEISKVEDLVLFLEDLTLDAFSRSSVLLEAFGSSKNITKVVDFNSEKTKLVTIITLLNRYSLYIVNVMKCHVICHNMYSIRFKNVLYFNIFGDLVNEKRSMNSVIRCVCGNTKLKAAAFYHCYKWYKIHCTQYIISYYILIKNEKKIEHVNYVDSAHASNIDHENVFLSTVVVRAIGKCLMSQSRKVILALKKQYLQA